MGSGSVGLTVNPAGTSWKATVDPADTGWLQLTTTGGTGSGTVGFTFGLNQGTARTGFLTIGGQTFSVTQAGSQTDTTIVPGNGYAYGADIGWLDWYADGANGAAIGQDFCFGYVYAANLGWINLGNGSPANGTTYSQSSPADFGVNVDGSGNLRGYAWGANIGWINFGINYPGSTGLPKVDQSTGQLSGYAWSANCGWISLNTGFGVLSTAIFPASATQLQVLLPGEIAAPGTATGKTGTAYPQVAGTPFNVTVNAVNANFDLININTANPNVSIGSSDLGANLPANQMLINGTAIFTVTLNTPGFQTVTGMDTVDSLSQGVSSQLPVNAAGMPAYNFVGITASPTSTTVAFTGLSGATYVIQGAPAVAGPWTDLTGEMVAPANGIIQFDAPAYAGSGSFFFRIEYISGP
jgi:hypothetical protein